MSGTDEVARTARLILRAWRDADRAPFAALNADPEVMRFFPAVLDRAQSDGIVDRLAERHRRDGFTFFAVECVADGRFIGFVGLARLRPELPIAPAVEIGWRLARHAWHRGYATEAARACLRLGFEVLGLPRIVAYAVEANAPSRAVMDRIGMRHEPALAFDHPALPPGDPLARHAVHVIDRADWVAHHGKGAAWEDGP